MAPERLSTDLTSLGEDREESNPVAEIDAIERRPQSAPRAFLPAKIHNVAGVRPSDRGRADKAEGLGNTRVDRTEWPTTIGPR